MLSQLLVYATYPRYDSTKTVHLSVYYDAHYVYPKHCQPYFYRCESPSVTRAATLPRRHRAPHPYLLPPRRPMSSSPEARAAAMNAAAGLQLLACWPWQGGCAGSRQPRPPHAVASARRSSDAGTEVLPHAVAGVIVLASSCGAPPISPAAGLGEEPLSSYGCPDPCEGRADSVGRSPDLAGPDPVGETRPDMSRRWRAGIVEAARGRSGRGQAAPGAACTWARGGRLADLRCGGGPTGRGKKRPRVVAVVRGGLARCDGPTSRSRRAAAALQAAAAVPGYGDACGQCAHGLLVGDGSGGELAGVPLLFSSMAMQVWRRRGGGAGVACAGRVLDTRAPLGTSNPEGIPSFSRG